MTVKAYRESLEALPHTSKDGRTLADILADSADIWSNDACKGYCIKAMQAAGVEEETICKVLNEFRDVFEFVNVDEAERAYRDY